MKEEFEKYFTDLSLSDVIKERIARIYDEITALYTGVVIDDIFICDIVSNGTKEYTSLWFFGPKFTIECKNFKNQDDYDLAYIDKNFAYFSIKKWKYEIGAEPTAESRVLIDSTVYGMGLTCNFSANGSNCKYLLEIARKYLIRDLTPKA